MRAAIELAVKLGGRGSGCLAERGRCGSTPPLSPPRLTTHRPPRSSRSISSRYASSLSFCDARLATSTAPHCSTVSRSTSPFALSVFPVSTRSTIQCDRLSSGATSTEPFTWMMSTGRPAGAEVRLRQARILGGDPRGDAAGQGGIGRVRRRGHHQAAEAEAQLERLQHVGAGLAEHVGAGDAQVGRAGLDVDRHVARLHHQELDAGVARRDEQPPARVGRGRGARPAEALDRRLVQPALGERHAEPAHRGTSAMVSRSSETPTAGIGRPNRAISSS